MRADGSQLSVTSDGSSFVGAGLDDTTVEEFEDLVFELLDPGGTGVSATTLVRALQGCAVLPSKRIAELASETMVSSSAAAADLATFRGCVERIVEAAAAAARQSAGHRPAGKAEVLLGVLGFVRRDAAEFGEFRLAARAQALGDAINQREEYSRRQAMEERHQAEVERAREAQLEQTIAFNRTWEANMCEFEQRALEVEEELRVKHSDEVSSPPAPPRGFKCSRELLALKRSVAVLAKMGKYEEAERAKKKADRLEAIELTRLDRRQGEEAAAREARLRHVQQQQVDGLRRRVDRGRTEHKEHWRQGAERLRQSHRNSMADLCARHTLERSRAEIAIKLDIGASRARSRRRSFADAAPRVDTGQPPRPKARSPWGGGGGGGAV